MKIMSKPYASQESRNKFDKIFNKEDKPIDKKKTAQFTGQCKHGIAIGKPCDKCFRFYADTSKKRNKS